MSFSDKEKTQAICAAIIFSSRFRRELEKTAAIVDPTAHEDAILLNRDEAIAEAVQIAQHIVNACDK